MTITEIVAELESNCLRYRLIWDKAEKFLRISDREDNVLFTGNPNSLSREELTLEVIPAIMEVE